MVVLIFYLPEAQCQSNDCKQLFKVPTSTAVFIEIVIQTKAEWKFPEKTVFSQNILFCKTIVLLQEVTEVWQTLVFSGLFSNISFLLGGGG